MPAFHNETFPLAVARGSIGGPERHTHIITLASGAEERNTKWAHALRRYDAGSGVRTLDDLHTIISFFEQRRGELYGFRFRDPVDWKSCPPMQAITPLDQWIATGDSIKNSFQLIKHYGDYARLITTPVASSVRVALDGTELMSGFSVDDETGIVIFDNIPANGIAITAGFAFDVPVRFDTKHLSIDITAFKAGAIPSIPLVEIRR